MYVCMCVVSVCLGQEGALALAFRITPTPCTRSLTLALLAVPAPRSFAPCSSASSAGTTNRWMSAKAADTSGPVGTCHDICRFSWEEGGVKKGRVASSLAPPAESGPGGKERYSVG